MPRARVELDARTRWALRAASVVVLLVGWELFARLSGTLFAPPTAVFGALVRTTVVEQTLLWAVLGALRNAAVGYALAVLVGVPVGFALGLSEALRAAFDPVLDALYATPVVALAPLIVIWFGLDSAGKVLLVFVFAVFVVAINTEAGVAETPAGSVDAARVFGAGPATVYGEVYLRGALPQVLTGLRLGAGRAVRGMVAAELFLYADALGTYLIDAGATFEVARFLAGVVALSLTGLLAVGAVAAVERGLLRYRDRSAAE
jgi:NitT/TauT family transport system permease protein